MPMPQARAFNVGMRHKARKGNRLGQITKERMWLYLCWTEEAGR